jgi:hypothetical protein
MATEMPGFGPPESPASANSAPASAIPPTSAIPNEMAPGLASLLGVHERQAGAKSDSIPAGLTKPDIAIPSKLRPAEPKRRGGVLPFFLLAGIFVGLLVAAYIFREPVSRVVPGAEEVYSLLGLTAADPAKELQIGNLKFEKRGSALLSVRGDIFNPTEMPLKVPPVWVVASDADGKTLEPSLMFRTQESELAPGETLTFRMLYENAPAATKTLRVTFGRVAAKEP